MKSALGIGIRKYSGACKMALHCAEWPDNNGLVSNIILPADAVFSTEAKPDLLNGITVLKSEASAVIIDSTSSTVSTIRQPFTAIPYYAWAHRGKGEMMVWLPVKVKQIEVISKE